MKGEPLKGEVLPNPPAEPEPKSPLGGDDMLCNLREDNGEEDRSQLKSPEACSEYYYVSFFTLFTIFTMKF